MSRPMVLGAAAFVLLAAVVLGRTQQVQYSNQHYTKSTLFLGEGGPQKAYEFAQHQQHKRIGIVGSSEIIFGQYGFYGTRRPTKWTTSACLGRTVPTAWRPPAVPSAVASTPATTTT